MKPSSQEDCRQPQPRDGQSDWEKELNAQGDQYGEGFESGEGRQREQVGDMAEEGHGAAG